MKQAFAIICFVFLLVQAGVMAQDSITYVEELPFQRGEFGKYRVYYDSWLTSGISAGVGLISIKDDVKQFNGRNSLHLEVIGKSVGLFNWFFKVDDRFEAYIDEETLAPYHFIRRTHEGSFIYEDGRVGYVSSCSALLPACIPHRRKIFILRRAEKKRYQPRRPAGRNQESVICIHERFRNSL